MKPIAHIHTDLPQKFGIPRNSFLAPHLQGHIVFEPEYALNSAVAGIDSFSHLWLLWRFENGEPGGGAADVADARAAAATDGREAAAYRAANGETPDSETAASAAAARKTTPAAEDNASLNRKDAPAAGVPANAGNAREGTATGERAAAPAAASPKPARWSPTVRPPRLGGAERVGVFATRSPFRPNPIGLTCVKLDRVELTDAGPIIHVLGADLRDGTPIYDIKPYLPYVDSHPDATGGFSDAVRDYALRVVIPDDCLARVPAAKREALAAVLAQDPRPGYRRDDERRFGIRFAGLDVRFVVRDGVLTVVEVASDGALRDHERRP